MIETFTPWERLRAFGRSQSAQWLALGVSVLTVGGVALIAIDQGPAPSGKRYMLSSTVSASTQDLPLIPPPVEPLIFKPIAPTEAIAINAAIPIVSDSNPAAAAFWLKTEDPIQRARATDCMTAAIYYEANSERLDGQAAVAQVVLNRLRHPSYPKTICGVVFQGSERPTGCQFTFTCDGALARIPDKARWLQARRIAEGALAGNVLAQVGLSTNYHTQSVVPYWGPTLRKTAVIGAHIFYRIAKPWGSPRVFSMPYAGNEPLEPLMAALNKEPGPVVVPPIIALPPVESDLVTPLAGGDADNSKLLRSGGRTSSPQAPPLVAPSLPTKPVDDTPKYLPPTTPKRRPHIAI